MTAAEELVLIDAALTQAYTANAQSYSGPAGRARTLLAINDLLARKRELELQINRETYGGFQVAQFRDPE